MELSDNKIKGLVREDPGCLNELFSFRYFKKYMHEQQIRFLLIMTLLSIKCKFNDFIHLLDIAYLNSDKSTLSKIQKTGTIQKRLESTFNNFNIRRSFKKYQCDVAYSQRNIIAMQHIKKCSSVQSLMLNSIGNGRIKMSCDASQIVIFLD